ncbi:hypothetical protein H4R19_000225 [Coemansia spiralis]|nr:hypothetical protein H4R19_000225 [Coemansia spiralis]
MEPQKLPIIVKVESSVGERQFIMVCKQRTVRDLKDELKRRLPAFSDASLELELDGCDLMDDDEVCDLLEPKSIIRVRAYGCKPAATEPAPATVSKVELGQGKPSSDTRTFVAEELYESLRESVSKLYLSDEKEDEDDSDFSCPESSEDDYSDSGTGSVFTDHDEKYALNAEMFTGSLEPRLRGYVKLDTAEMLDTLPFVSYGELRPYDIIAYRLRAQTADGELLVTPYRIGQVVTVDTDAVAIKVFRELELPAAATTTENDACTENYARRRTASGFVPGHKGHSELTSFPPVAFLVIRRL